VDRPKAVDMKTLDPCSLVTPETKTALGIRTAEALPADQDYGEHQDRNYGALDCEGHRWWFAQRLPPKAR